MVFTGEGLKDSSSYWAFKRFEKLCLFFFVLLVLIFSFLNETEISLLNFFTGWCRDWCKSSSSSWKSWLGEGSLWFSAKSKYWMNISKSSNKAKEQEEEKKKLSIHVKAKVNLILKDVQNLQSAVPFAKFLQAPWTRRNG